MIELSYSVLKEKATFRLEITKDLSNFDGLAHLHAFGPGRKELQGHIMFPVQTNFKQADSHIIANILLDLLKRLAPVKEQRFHPPSYFLTCLAQAALDETKGAS